MAVPASRFRKRAAEPISLLYVCYLGLEEPLVQTQVVPYLTGLSAAGYGVVLLTFEPGFLSREVRRRHEDALRARRIEWHTLRYHKRPALPATLADIVAGIAYGAYLVRTRRITVVHARGHVPAVMALILHRFIHTRFVFDIRGLLADEYVDAGLWRKGGFLFRLVKRVEDVFLTHADAAVVLTRRARQWLFDVRRTPPRGLPPVEVIPCCVDLRRFEVDPADVERAQRSLGLHGHPVLIYTGKLGGWYMAREMVEFFRTARRRIPDLRLLVLTQSPATAAEEELVRQRVDSASYRCLQVPSRDVPAYLALADFAISFRVPGFSQVAASPTKMGEYLAAGLPVVYNAGVGDLDDLEEERVGALIEAFEASDYLRATDRIRALLAERSATAQRCRAVAERCFSLTTVGIPAYLRLYAALAGPRAPRAPGRAPREGGAP